MSIFDARMACVFFYAIGRISDNWNDVAELKNMKPVVRIMQRFENTIVIWFIEGVEDVGLFQ